MIDREKVIIELEQCLDDSIAAVVPADTVRAALALLKEQEPMKPSWRRGIPFCGKCGRQFGHGFKYCPDCGRAVKWE